MCAPKPNNTKTDQTHISDEVLNLQMQLETDNRHKMDNME